MLSQDDPMDLVKIGSCLLQALVSHYCGKPLGVTKNKQKTKNKTMLRHRMLMCPTMLHHKVIM